MKNYYFKCAIKDWKIDDIRPQGVLRGKIGQIGKIGIESEAILVDSSITWDQCFDENVTSCLPEIVSIFFITFF